MHHVQCEKDRLRTLGEPALKGLLRMNKLQESPLKMEEEVFSTSEHTVRKFDAVEENSGRQNSRNIWGWRTRSNR